MRKRTKWLVVEFVGEVSGIEAAPMPNKNIKIKGIIKRIAL